MSIKTSSDPGVPFEIAIANLIESLHPDYNILQTDTKDAFDLLVIKPDGRKVGIEVKNRVNTTRNPSPLYFDPTQVEPPYTVGPPRRTSTLLLDKNKYDNLKELLKQNKVDNIIILYIFSNCIAYSYLEDDIREVKHFCPRTTSFYNTSGVLKEQVEFVNPETYPIDYSDLCVRYLYQSRVFEGIKIKDL